MMARRFALALVVVLASASPAGALTCARFPENTPEALVGNQLGLPSSDIHRYDLAVVGTVRRITTDEDGNSPTYGRTTVEVEVAGIFSATFAEIQVDQLWDGLSVTSPDPGWMSGYRYVEGQGYFIPLLRTGPSGESNYSFLCDPIYEVADPMATAVELSVIADHSGLDHVLFTDAVDTTSTHRTVPDLELADAGTETESPDPSGGFLSLVTIGLFLGLLVWTLARRQTGRRRFSERDSDLRRPPGPRR